MDRERLAARAKGDQEPKNADSERSRGPSESFTKKFVAMTNHFVDCIGITVRLLHPSAPESVDVTLAR